MSSLCRVIIGLGIVLSASSAAALNIDYQFDPTNSPAGAPLFDVTATATFPGGPSSSTGIDLALGDWVMPLHAIISDDRRSARLEATDLTWTGAPQSVSGAWDLGFSGTVPFTVTLTSLSVSIRRLDVSLRPDGSFFANQRSELTAQGFVETLGMTVPFAVSGGSHIFSHSGKFTASGSFVDLALMDATPGTVLSPVLLFAGSVPGFSLTLRGSTNWAGTSLFARGVVPEPATAVLLAIGLGALAARRRA
jgi:hypothetical protein